MEAWVYILKCSDSSYYTGSTTDLENRLHEHATGAYDGYTAARRPLKLVWSDDFPGKDQVFDVERQIKGWTRNKKEPLIHGDFKLLHELAECKNKTNFEKKEKD